MTFLPALLVPIPLGFALVSLFWERNREAPGSLLLKGSLSVGLGFGLTSALFFLWIMVAGRFGTGFILLESGLFVFLAGAFFLTRPRGEWFRFLRGDASVQATANRWLFVLPFYGVLALSFSAFLYLLWNRPHGGWDAWAMWNMRARFLFRGGDHWRDVFSVLGELHPDYPFLVPGVVARAWSYLGSDPVSVSAVASLGFTLATVFLLVSSLRYLRGGSQGYVAGIVLLGASAFVRHGASQYADVYIGFFFLASLVLASLAFEGEKEYRGLTILAGTAAALAAWTKNEGIPFLFFFLAAGTLINGIFDGARTGLRRLALLAAGAFPVTLLVLYFKMRLAPPTDILVEQQGGALLARLLDPSRYATVTKAFLVAGVWKFLLPVLAVYLLLLGLDRDRVRGKGFLVSVATLLAMFVSYFMVYVTTSKPLEWHLGTSLDRVLVQLWPSFLFSFFLLVRVPESLLVAVPSSAATGPPAGNRRRRDRHPKRGKKPSEGGKGRTR
jgi:hypothetical protein